jgi:hypothetical protein
MFAVNELFIFSRLISKWNIFYPYVRYVCAFLQSVHGVKADTARLSVPNKLTL